MMPTFVVIYYYETDGNFSLFDCVNVCTRLFILSILLKGNKQQKKRVVSWLEILSSEL